MIKLLMLHLLVFILMFGYAQSNRWNFSDRSQYRNGTRTSAKETNSLGIMYKSPPRMSAILVSPHLPLFSMDNLSATCCHILQRKQPTWVIEELPYNVPDHKYWGTIGHQVLKTQSSDSLSLLLKWRYL